MGCGCGGGVPERTIGHRGAEREREGESERERAEREREGGGR